MDAAQIMNSTRVCEVHDERMTLSHVPYIYGKPVIDTAFEQFVEAKTRYSPILLVIFGEDVIWDPPEVA